MGTTEANIGYGFLINKEIVEKFKLEYEDHPFEDVITEVYQNDKLTIMCAFVVKKSMLTLYGWQELPMSFDLGEFNEFYNKYKEEWDAELKKLADYLGVEFKTGKCIFCCHNY